MTLRISLTWLLFVFVVQTAIAQPHTYSGFELNWFDEFGGTELDQTKWTPVFSTSPTNSSLHAYLPDNILVSGGNMIIVSTDEPFGSFDYRSGFAISKTEHRYGRFEVRGNLPTSKGMWPAIWLNPDQPPLWPSQGEIDIMENRGDQPFLTSSAFHWGTNPPFVHNFVYDENTATKNGQSVNYHNSFHTYAVEWDPEQIRYYVDGAHYYTVRNSNVQNFMTTAQTNPMRLLINTAIGGLFLDNPDETTQWPQHFEVDYVYVYDRVGDPTLALENGNFDTNEGSLSDWSLFGHNGTNVSVEDDHVLSQPSALKLFGQFNGNQNFSGVEQGISVLPGDNLTLSASSFVASNDSLAGTGNQVLLKLDFYNTIYGAFGSPQYESSQGILIADSTTPTNQWIEHEINVTVPSNAIEARAALVFQQVSNASGSVFIDDIEFVNQTAVETLDAESVSVIAGSVSSGNETDLNFSDDAYFEVLAGMVSGLSPVEMLFEATTTFSEPTAIEFKIESAANTLGTTQTIAALNFDTGEFEEIGTISAGISDEIESIVLNGDPSRFVSDTDQNMIVKSSWQATSPTLFFPWEIRIDNVVWTVQR